jgi:hypothetical protein
MRRIFLLQRILRMRRILTDRARILTDRARGDLLTRVKLRRWFRLEHVALRQYPPRTRRIYR